MNNKELIDSIKKIIDNTSNEHPYKQVGNRDSYSQYNEAWSDACDILGNRIIDKLKSINSTRLSERRADGSNSKAKEVCPRTGLCDIYEQWGFCPYQCALFNRGQTD